MKNKTINCGGLLLFFGEEGRKKYLLVKNSETEFWEPPKGVKEAGESYLKCALRECHEETSIKINPTTSFVFSPYEMTYSISDAIEKRLLLFPIDIGGHKIVNLSAEHSEYKWLDYDQLSSWYKKNLIQNNYFDIISNIERTIKTDSPPRNNNIINVIEKVLTSNKQLSDFNWYLTGSIAADELTFGNDGILSDIDLVAFGRHLPYEDRVKKNAESILGDVQSVLSLNHINNIGISYQLSNTRLNVADPFWSYFKEYSISLSSNMNGSISYIENPSAIDNNYNLFRLLWYTALRSNYNSVPENNYNFTKASILLFYFLFYRGSTFYGYRNLKDKLFQILSNNHTNEHEEIHHALLNSINYKLNKTDQSLLRDPKEFFYDFFNLALDRLNTTEFILSKTIINIEHSLFIYDDDLIWIAQKALSSNNTGFNTLYTYAIDTCNKQILWLLLLLLRVQIWPDMVRYSLYKYEFYMAFFCNHLNSVPDDILNVLDNLISTYLNKHKRLNIRRVLNQWESCPTVRIMKGVLRNEVQTVK